jgi:hypothetical protein
MTSRSTIWRTACAAATAVAAACVLHASPRANAVDLAELWEMPRDMERRDLFHGPGGAERAPDSRVRYELIEADDTGFSPGYDVRDPRGRTWSVKLGPEARTEVVVSRVVWAVGYRQPDVYHVPQWTLVKDGKAETQPAGRFRLERKEFDKVGEWSWRDNEFIGTRPFGGLIALMVIVNNWDVKTSQNAVYQAADGNGNGRGDAGTPRRWFVVRDLGASLGKTNWFFPGNRDDVEAFEKEPFIAGVEGNRVRFHYKGAWLEPQLTSSVTPSDVVWVCQLLSQLSQRQWQDAFRAGGYSEAEARRFIRRLQQKIDEGLRLGEG